MTAKVINAAINTVRGIRARGDFVGNARLSSIKLVRVDPYRRAKARGATPRNGRTAMSGENGEGITG